MHGLWFAKAYWTSERMCGPKCSDEPYHAKRSKIPKITSVHIGSYFVVACSSPRRERAFTMILPTYQKHTQSTLSSKDLRAIWVVLLWLEVTEDSGLVPHWISPE